MTISREEWAKGFLDYAGWSVSQEKIVALVAQASKEDTQAENNPLACGEDAPTATDFNAIVKNYATLDAGYAAVLAVMKSGYPGLVAVLDAETGGSATQYATSPTLDKWGTGDCSAYVAELKAGDPQHWLTTPINSPTAGSVTPGAHYPGYPGVPDDPTQLPEGIVVKLPDGTYVERTGPAVHYFNPHDPTFEAKTAGAVDWPPATSTPTPAPEPAHPAPTVSVSVNVAELSEADPGPGTVSGPVQSVQSLLESKFKTSVGAAGIDGRFGPATTEAVRSFQTRAQITVDGIVGPVTWAHLLTRLGS